MGMGPEREKFCFCTRGRNPCKQPHSSFQQCEISGEKHNGSSSTHSSKGVAGGLMNIGYELPMQAGNEEDE